MNEGIMRQIIGIKLKIIDGIIEKLPSEVGGRVRDMERDLLSAIHESTKEYVPGNDKEREKNIKSISID